MIDRSDLITRLGVPPARRLVVVSAPVGYGKTALVRQWRSALGDAVPTGWVNAGDCRDETQLWTMVCEAVESLRSLAGHPESGRDDVSVRRVEPPSSVVVIDDLNLSPQLVVDLAAEFFEVEPTSSLVVTTRRRPARQLSRMVLAGDAEVLTDDDLRLTND